LKDSRLIVDAVLFDLDGTLIDSTDIYIRIAEEIFRRLDLPPVSGARILERIRDTNNNWESLFPVETKERDSLIREARGVFQEISPRLFTENIKMIPGSVGALKGIAGAGIRIGLVTSTHARSLDGKLRPLKEKDVLKLIEITVAIEDTPRIKPEPDPLIECARRMGVPLHKSVYVGDSRTDIRAGNSAGMKTIGVLTGMDDYDTIKNEDPYTIIGSVAELSNVICY